MGSTTDPQSNQWNKKLKTSAKGFPVLKSYSTVQYRLSAACKTPKEGISEPAGEESCGRRMPITSQTLAAALL